MLVLIEERNSSRQILPYTQKKREEEEDEDEEEKESK